MRSVRLCSLPLVAIVVAAGCGGGHSSGSGNLAATASPSGESSGRDACSLTKYAPNYAANITLTYWPQFPLAVYFDTTAASYTADLQTRAVTAFDGWVTNSGGQVAYTVVSDPALADITVSFVPVTSTILSSYDADGITYYYPGAASTIVGDTADQYAESVQLYVGIDGVVDRENGTMGHEFGHALGIRGHSPVSTDIMYYRWNSTRSQTPTARDINTLDTAYCGVFSRAEPARSAQPASHRPIAPPLTDPGWRVIQ